jgi:hypothetical protein
VLGSWRVGGALACLSALPLPSRGHRHELAAAAQTTPAPRLAGLRLAPGRGLGLFHSSHLSHAARLEALAGAHPVGRSLTAPPRAAAVRADDGRLLATGPVPVGKVEQRGDLSLPIGAWLTADDLAIPNVELVEELAEEFTTDLRVARLPCV